MEPFSAKPNLVDPQQGAAAALTFTQVASAATATLIVAASASRKELWLQNLDASILVYAAPLETVAATTGVLLPPRGASIRVTGKLATLAWYGIAASGTPTLVYGAGV